MIYLPQQPEQTVELVMVDKAEYDAITADYEALRAHCKALVEKVRRLHNIESSLVSLRAFIGTVPADEFAMNHSLRIVEKRISDMLGQKPRDATVAFTFEGPKK